MLLFTFSLVLAGLAVGLAAVMGVGSTYLQTTYLLSVGAVIGVAGVIGLVIALLEKSSLAKRARQMDELRQQPSGLSWPSQSSARATSSQALPVTSMPELTPMPEELLLPTEDEDVPVAPEAPKAPVVQEAPKVQEAPRAPVAQEAPKAQEVPKAQETPKVQVKDSSLEVRESQVTLELSEPDQVLYLDPEVELADIKRVLNIWQMTFEETTEHGQMARWTAPDGTTIDMFEASNGYPTFEIRGDMASELAEFLPQDLPIYPELPEPR